MLSENQFKAVVGSVVGGLLAAGPTFIYTHNQLYALLAGLAGALVGIAFAFGAFDFLLELLECVHEAIF
jgi:hypothetical protein